MTPESLARALLVAVFVLISAAASGKQLYDYVDGNGIRHFTDVPPQTDQPVSSTRIRTEPKPLIDLSTRRVDGGSVMALRNLSDGPVEVELRLDRPDNIVSEPPLPARVVLEAREHREVARARAADPRRDSSYRVLANAVPGDPRVRPDPDTVYQVPFASGTRYAIGQSFGGSFSHTDPQNYHAVDFGVEEGTPVLAARDGVVVQVERDFYESGGDRNRLAARANYVRVMHEDGTMAVYAHLAFETVVVQPGSVVLAGQHLGNAGATGFATGPHLHFVVQRNAGLSLRSIPFRLDGPDGPRTPETSSRWQRAP